MDILLHINYFNCRIKQIPQIKDSYKLVRKKPTQMKNIKKYLLTENGPQTWRYLDL